LTTNHIKAILTSLRAMVIKMLPAYKFYLGTEISTSEETLLTATIVDGEATVSVSDTFGGFVEGDIYNVTLDGETTQTAAKDVAYLMYFFGA
jgi:hypothetical protein